MNPRRLQNLDTQVLARDGAATAIKTPDREVRRDALLLVPLHRFGRHIENAAVLERAQKLDVLGVGPDQRHGGAGGFATKQFALRHIVPVPNLFGNETDGTGASLERVQQSARFVEPTSGDLVVRTLAGQ